MGGLISVHPLMFLRYIRQRDDSVKGLFFLQFCRRVGLCGLERLPEDRAESHRKCKSHREDEYPSIVLKSIDITLQIFLSRQDSHRNADDTGDSHQHHIIFYRPPGLTRNIAAEHLSHRYALGILA